MCSASLETSSNRLKGSLYVVKYEACLYDVPLTY